MAFIYRTPMIPEINRTKGRAGFSIQTVGAASRVLRQALPEEAMDKTSRTTLPSEV